MNIIKAGREFTKEELYKLTHNRSTILKDLVGQELTVTDWMFYADENQRREQVEVLVLVTDAGYASTISQTLIREFLDIADTFSMPVKILIVGGKTKNGRDYISCELA